MFLLASFLQVRYRQASFFSCRSKLLSRNCSAWDFPLPGSITFSIPLGSIPKGCSHLGECLLWLYCTFLSSFVSSPFSQSSYQFNLNRIFHFSPVGILIKSLEVPEERPSVLDSRTGLLICLTNVGITPLLRREEVCVIHGKWWHAP